MKSEIRGLKSGEYYSKDRSLLLRIYKNDNGVVIELADKDADIFYAVGIDEKGKSNFEWGSITPSLDDKKGDCNGEG